VANPARRSGQKTPESSFWKERWNNTKHVAGAIIEDVMLFSIFVVGISFAYLVLGILAWVGYSSQRIEMFETIHYYAYLAALGLLMLDFVITIGLHMVRKVVVPEQNL
jgi:hypothetical protein